MGENKKSYLRIIATPPEATISVNTLRVNSGETVSLPPGDYRVTVSHPGFQTQVKEVSLGKGESK